MNSTVIHTAKIKYKGKIPSVNQLYLPRRSGNKVWTYQNPEAVDYKKFIEHELRKAWDGEFDQYKGKEIAAHLNISFVYNDRFWRRDVSNLVKATEDSIVNATGIDDSVNLVVETRKVLNDLDDSEYIVIVLAVTELTEFKYKWSQFTNGN